MQSIIKELYYGNISPDSKNYGQDQSYQKAIRVKNGYRDKLEETLDESEKKLLEQYAESRSIIEDIVNCDTFSYALRLGILLMVETFANGNKLTNGIKITIESEGQEKCTKL